MLHLEREAVTDLHCFALPVTGELREDEVVRLFSNGGPTVRGFARNVVKLEDSFSLRYFLRSLSDFLGCEPDLGHMLKARNRRARDFWDYVRELIKDARIDSLVLDDGLYREALDTMQKNAPCKLYRVVRLEPLLDQVLYTAGSFDELLERYSECMRHAISGLGAKGFKSVIAYRTGLNVTPVSAEDAKDEFLKVKAGGGERRWFGPYAKKLRNYLLLNAAEFAARNGVMLQLHTGLGDTDILGDGCNPLLLEPALKDGGLGKTNVVLIHGGYPYSQEAAWLAQAFPNVFLETSTPIPPRFFPPLSSGVLKGILEMAPVSKIVYGSDGHGIPEFIWLSAKTAKRQLAQVLGDYVIQKLITEREARKWGSAILSQNASQLLHI